MNTLTTAALITLLSFGSAMADQIQDNDRYGAVDWANNQSEQVVSNLEPLAPTAAGRTTQDEHDGFNLNGPFEDMQD